MKFLCVDDSATLRKIVSISMGALGHSVSEAENGKEGLKALDSGGTPDCIVLDVNMPIMGGLEFLAEKAKVPAWKSIPVVVMTTQDEAPLRDRAFALGARNFLAKPFQKERLLEAIQRATKL
jgi:two-component system, chemotaxis family, chemotaxis protein CheY